MNELYIQLLNAAVDSCKEALSNSNTDKIVSFDGMWNSIRNAPYCIVDHIDVTTGKVIDFQIVTRLDLELVPKHTNVLQVKDIASNEFEIKGLSLIRDREAFAENTKYYVHDLDTKAKAVITKEGADVSRVERFDFNHLTKGLFKS